MEEVFPFLLIIVGWNPADPDASMALQSSVHVSQEACEIAGQTFVAEREPLRSAPAPAAYKYFCIPAPGRNEVDNDVFGLSE